MVILEAYAVGIQGCYKCGSSSLIIDEDDDYKCIMCAAYNGNAPTKRRPPIQEWGQISEGYLPINHLEGKITVGIDWIRKKITSNKVAASYFGDKLCVSVEDLVRLGYWKTW